MSFSGSDTECLPITLHQQPFDIRLPVQDFPSQLDIRHAPRIPVFLQCPAAGLQQFGHFPVCQVAFPAQYGAVVFGYNSMWSNACSSILNSAAICPLSLVINSFIVSLI